MGGSLRRLTGLEAQINKKNDVQQHDCHIVCTNGYYRLSTLRILRTQTPFKIKPPGRWTNAHPPCPPSARWYLGGFSQRRRTVVTTTLPRHSSVARTVPTRDWSPTSARPSPTAFTTASTIPTRRTNLLLVVGSSAGRSAARTLLAMGRDSPRLQQTQCGSRYMHAH